MEKSYPFSIRPDVEPSCTRSTQLNDLRATSSSGTGVSCLVCQLNEARYTCPKCKVVYCSLSCYKDHDENCSESFFRDRVNNVIAQEQREGSNKMLSILSRVRQDLEEEDEASEDELWILAEALEKGCLNDKEVERLLTPDMKSSFDHAIKTGQLSGAIQRWHPWWIPNFAIDLKTEDHQYISRQATLDDRLLAIPRFSNLRPGSNPTTQLSFNMIDLLYSAAWTLRQYHGVENAEHVCVEASLCFIQFSRVLRDDFRFHSVAESLVACTNTKASIHWTVLAKDVSRLWNRRNMAHALMDVAVLLKAASKELDGEHASQMRKWRKKVEFYISWSLDASLPPIGDEIDSWINDWSSQEEFPNVDILPNSTGCTERKETRPLNVLF